MHIFERFRKQKIVAEDFKHFLEADSASRWGTAHYGAWSAEYKGAQQDRKRNSVGLLGKSPIENYCGNIYQHINQALWVKDKTLSTQYQEMEGMLHSIIDAAPHIPEPIVLYRLEDPHTVALLDAAYRKRQVVEYKSYISTSMLESIAERGEAVYAGRQNMLKLYVPAGVSGIYVDDICNREEHEIVLQRGQKLQVLRKRKRQRLAGSNTVKDIIECLLIC